MLIHSSGTFPLHIPNLRSGSHKIELMIEGLRGASASVSINAVIVGKD